MPAYNWKLLAERLNEALGLSHPPIAVTFSQEALAGMPVYQGDMPPPSGDGRTGKVAAGCVFWVRSEDRTFATVPEDHYNCSVGSVVHGLKTLDEVMGNEDIQSMVACDWVTPEEARHLPVVQQRPQYITYGPLAETPQDPDIVLLRLSAFQAMVIHDAFGDMPIVGKPQCHIIPIAKEQNRVAISTGCMLSRIRTGMSPDELTCTIPAVRLKEAVEKLEARRQADATMGSYANRDGRRFAQA